MPYPNSFNFSNNTLGEIPNKVLSTFSINIEAFSEGTYPQIFYLTFLFLLKLIFVYQALNLQP